MGQGTRSMSRFHQITREKHIEETLRYRYMQNHSGKDPRSTDKQKKNKQMGLHQDKKLLHCKGNYQQ